MWEYLKVVEHVTASPCCSIEAIRWRSGSLGKW